MSVKRSKAPKAEPPVIAFAAAAAFRRWLKANHATHPGIWMQIARKDSGLASITYAEALDEALSYGCIDGQRQTGDAKTWRQKFTRRGPRSAWSKINVGHVDRLTRAGRMQPAGLAAVDAAKADGRWSQAYSSARTMEIPKDFLAALAKHPKARAFFEALNKTNRYAIGYRLETAKKPETRSRRLAAIVDMMRRGEKFH